MPAYREFGELDRRYRRLVERSVHVRFERFRGLVLAVGRRILHPRVARSNRSRDGLFLLQRLRLGASRHQDFHGSHREFGAGLHLGLLGHQIRDEQSYGVGAAPARHDGGDHPVGCAGFRSCARGLHAFVEPEGHFPPPTKRTYTTWLWPRASP